VIEAAILADDDEHMLDRRGGLEPIDRFVSVGGARPGGAEPDRGKRDGGNAGGDPQLSVI
jgi:hypothetical protein